MLRFHWALRLSTPLGTKHRTVLLGVLGGSVVQTGFAFGSVIGRSLFGGLSLGLLVGLRVAGRDFGQGVLIVFADESQRDSDCAGTQADPLDVTWKIS